MVGHYYHRHHRRRRRRHDFCGDHPKEDRSILPWTWIWFHRRPPLPWVLWRRRDIPQQPLSPSSIRSFDRSCRCLLSLMMLLMFCSSTQSRDESRRNTKKRKMPTNHLDFHGPFSQANKKCCIIIRYCIITGANNKSKGIAKDSRTNLFEGIISFRT